VAKSVDRNRSRGIKNKIESAFWLLPTYYIIWYIYIIHNHKLQFTLFDNNIIAEVESISVVEHIISWKLRQRFKGNAYAVAYNNNTQPRHLRWNSVHFSRTGIIIYTLYYNYISYILSIKLSVEMHSENLRWLACSICSLTHVYYTV